MTTSREKNTDFRDSVNIQSNGQNPHDPETSQQQGHAGDLGLPKSVDEYVAEYRFDPEIDYDHADTVNVQHEVRNPHDPRSKSCRQNLDEYLETEIGMLVKENRTRDHILDNDKTAQHLRNGCELLEECGNYLMLEICSDINLVATSDGEMFQFNEFYDPDAETDFNPVVEIIEQTAPEPIQRSLLNYEVVSGDELNPEDYIDIGDLDELQVLREIPGTFYVAPGLQNRYDT